MAKHAAANTFTGKRPSPEICGRTKKAALRYRSILATYGRKMRLDQAPVSRQIPYHCAVNVYWHEDSTPVVWCGDSRPHALDDLPRRCGGCARAVLCLESDSLTGRKIR